MTDGPGTMVIVSVLGDVPDGAADDLRVLEDLDWADDVVVWLDEEPEK